MTLKRLVIRKKTPAAYLKDIQAAHDRLVDLWVADWTRISGFDDEDKELLGVKIHEMLDTTENLAGCVQEYLVD